MTEPQDTIVAIATPAGRGGIGVVRVSGPQAFAIARALCNHVPPPRVATFGAIRDAAGDPIDTGLVLTFPSPHSYTGEDVVELQLHGSPPLLQLVVDRCVALGARRARPGEFSERAFLNGKLDLVQAEAVADLIDAGSTAAARAAVRSLQGEFSREVHALAKAITRLRVLVEAAIDFPDEDVEFLASPQVAAQAADIEAQFAAIESQAARGRRLRDGLVVVIAGKPNAGKSSLMNRLAGHDAAIVTPTPGTTRDVLRESIDLDGLPVELIDTAGLRETRDPIEAEGVRRARQAAAHADLVLYVVDASVDTPAATETIEQPTIVVFNKVDLVDAARVPDDALRVSAMAGTGVDELRARLKAHAGFATDAGGTFTARQRHLDALCDAHEAVRSAVERLRAGATFELAAEDLRRAHTHLGSITGVVTSDDLLGEIFGSFCIGK